LVLLLFFYDLWFWRVQFDHSIFELIEGFHQWTALTGLLLGREVLVEAALGAEGEVVRLGMEGAPLVSVFDGGQSLELVEGGGPDFEEVLKGLKS
jgi:hypothetical protein